MTLSPHFITHKCKTKHWRVGEICMEFLLSGWQARIHFIFKRSNRAVILIFKPSLAKTVPLVALLTANENHDISHRSNR